MVKGGAVTEQRDLRTGTPFWLRHGDKHLPGRPLAADVTVDAAIVGAGVSGAVVADALVRTGRSVAVLDRRGPVKGSTPASTALLQFEIDQPLLHLAQKIGEVDPAAMVAGLWRSVLSRGARSPRPTVRSSMRDTRFLPPVTRS